MWVKKIVLLMSVLSCAAGVQAQGTYPSRPIRLVVPFAAGGPTDAVARIIGEEIGRSLGQPVIVENKAGASGAIGQDYVSKSAPDGYTLAMITGTSSNNYHLMRRTLDFYKDFSMVGRIYNTYTVLAINPQAPGMGGIVDLSQLVAYIKAHPGELNYTSSGTGSLGHLTMEKIKLHHGLQIEHVPYKGQALATQDVLAGRVPILSGTFTMLPLIAAGKLRPIAMGTEKPSSLLPNVGTFAEQGIPGLISAVWIGVAAPPATPQVIVERLGNELRTALDKPEVSRKVVAAVGNQPEYLNGPDFAAFATRDFEYWGRVIRDAGIKGE